MERGCKDTYRVSEDLQGNIEIIIGSRRKGSPSYVLAEILALLVVTWKTERLPKELIHLAKEKVGSSNWLLPTTYGKI